MMAAFGKSDGGPPPSTVPGLVSDPISTVSLRITRQGTGSDELFGVEEVEGSIRSSSTIIGNSHDPGRVIGV
jgi:hypothetical protein